MTTTAPAVPAGTAKAPRDLRRTFRILIAVALPLGPFGVLLTRAVQPYWNAEGEGAIIADIAASPGRAEALVWFSLLCYPPLVLGALANGYVCRRTAPRIGLAAAGFTFVGYTLAAQLGSTDLLAHAMAQDGISQAAILEASRAMMSHPALVVALLSFLLGHLVGGVLTGIAVVKAGLVPRWVGAALVLSQPVHVISVVAFPSRLLDVTLGWGLATLCFAMVGLAVLRTPDDEWDLPPVR